MIQLSKGKKAWMAEFTEKDKEFLSKAGLSNPAPTVFSKKANPEEVLTIIQKLNPDSVVEIKKEES
jgi:hypothetical protein